MQLVQCTGCWFLGFSRCASCEKRNDFLLCLCSAAKGRKQSRNEYIELGFETLIDPVQSKCLGAFRVSTHGLEKVTKPS